MKLILQGPGAISHTIERIAALAHATHITAIADSAFRCDGVIDTPSIRESVENSCIEEHIDHSFISKDYRLDDFRVLVMDMDSTTEMGLDLGQGMVLDLAMVMNEIKVKNFNI
jgi:phosphoserine phosphatase